MLGNYGGGEGVKKGEKVLKNKGWKATQKFSCKTYNLIDRLIINLFWMEATYNKLDLSKDEVQA